MTKRRELSFCEFMREYCAGAWKYAIGCWLGVFAGCLLSFAGDYGEETYKKKKSDDKQYAFPIHDSFRYYDSSLSVC